MAQAIASELSDELGRNLVVQPVIEVLEQCYERASVTAGMFNQPKGINYYKEAAQFCYWLRKLKPFMIVRVNERDAGAELSERETNVNEYVAYFFASHLIGSAHRVTIGQMLEKGQIERARSNQKARQYNMMRGLEMESRVASSLRYFVYSSGSLPMLLEAMYWLPLDEEFAYHNEEPIFDGVFS